MSNRQDDALPEPGFENYPTNLRERKVWSDGWQEGHKAAIASLQARLDAAEADAARLDSGRILIGGRDEFGEPTTVIHCGMNLRSAIDAAAEGV